MPVAFDAATEHVRTGTTSPQTFSHTPATLNNDVKGVVLAIVHGGSATDHVSAASYGGIAMTRLQRNVDTATELGAAELWHLGSGIPQGTQTVSYTPGATTDDIHAVVITLTADADTEPVDSDGISENVAGPSVTLQYGGRTCIAIAALYGGGAAPTSFAPNVNCVTVHDHDLGAFYSEIIRQTTPGSADFAIGGTAGSDDVAFAAVAISEVQVGQQFTITLDEAVGAADAEPRQTGKALPDAAALADTLSKLTGRSLAEATALADAITKAPGKVLVDGVAIADTVEAQRIVVKDLLEALATADVLTKAAGRTVVEGVTLADLVERLTARQLTDAAAVADALSRLTGKPLSETASIADTLTATLIVEHTVLEAVATVDDVAVTVGRVLVDTATVADVLSRVAGRALVEAVALADAATKAVSRGLLDQVAVADTLTVLRISLTVLSESATVADTFDSNLTPYSGPTLPPVSGGTRSVGVGHTTTDRSSGAGAWLQGSPSYVARSA